MKVERARLDPVERAGGQQLDGRVHNRPEGARQAGVRIPGPPKGPIRFHEACRCQRVGRIGPHDHQGIGRWLPIVDDRAEHRVERRPEPNGAVVRRTSGGRVGARDATELLRVCCVEHGRQPAPGDQVAVIVQRQWSIGWPIDDPQLRVEEFDREIAGDAFVGACDDVSIKPSLVVARSRAGGILFRKQMFSETGDRRMGSSIR
jgi:hypothetical protein